MIPAIFHKFSFYLQRRTVAESFGFKYQQRPPQHVSEFLKRSYSEALHQPLILRITSCRSVSRETFGWTKGKARYDIKVFWIQQKQSTLHHRMIPILSKEIKLSRTCSKYIDCWKVK